MITRKSSNLEDIDVFMKVENFGMSTKFSIEKRNSILHVEYYITILVIITALISYKYVQTHYSFLIIACLLVYLFYMINSVTKGKY